MFLLLVCSGLVLFLWCAFHGLSILSTSCRNARQLPPRAAAALYSSPQQPCMVHGCPLTGHLKLDTSSVGEVNHRIKLSAQWGDVAKVVAEMGERLQPSNIAYALYRLGCLFTFLSSQRKTGLRSRPHF